MCIYQGSDVVNNTNKIINRNVILQIWLIGSAHLVVLVIIHITIHYQLIATK